MLLKEFILSPKIHSNSEKNCNWIHPTCKNSISLKSTLDYKLQIYFKVFLICIGC